MSGTTSWNVLVVRKIVRYGRKMNTYYSYVTGPRYEDKLLAGQVTVTSTLSIIPTNRIW